MGLMNDPAYNATTFIVIDFEATTPKGYRPEPIEVAALAIRDLGDGLADTGRFAELIQPPPHAPITHRDTAENGLGPADVIDARLAGPVLADLDASPLWASRDRDTPADCREGIRLRSMPSLAGAGPHRSRRSQP
jgi:hypothetical protein